MDERKNGHRDDSLDPSLLPVPSPEQQGKHVRYGAPNKLTDDRHALIIECLRKGYSMEATAALAGVVKSTIYRWLRKAKEGDEYYGPFLMAMQEASAQFEGEAIDAIVGAGKNGTWQAYAWMMERKHPERWGKRNVTRHEGHEGGPIEFSLNMNVGKEPIQRIVEVDSDDE